MRYDTNWAFDAELAQSVKNPARVFDYASATAAAAGFGH